MCVCVQVYCEFEFEFEVEFGGGLTGWVFSCEEKIDR